MISIHSLFFSQFVEPFLNAVDVGEDILFLFSGKLLQGPSAAVAAERIVAVAVLFNTLGQDPGADIGAVTGIGQRQVGFSDLFYPDGVDLHVPEIKRTVFIAMDGIFILSGSCFRPGANLQNASIIDIAPTLLHALGLPVSTNMDGRVLLEAFRPGHEKVHYAQPAEAMPVEQSALTNGEENEIVERLRGLGYLE